MLACIVSTHAPLAGSDWWLRSVNGASSTFQPTLPLRGATRMRRACAPSPRFNPRSPCGERRMRAMLVIDGLMFQPTLPLRGATMSASLAGSYSLFQPTLPLRGATATSC